MKAKSKPPIAVIAAAALLCLVLVSMSMASGMFARYTVKAENPEDDSDALVRANYADIQKGIVEDKRYLELFFRNLLLGEKNELKNRYLIIDAPEQIEQVPNNLTEQVRLLVKSMGQDIYPIKALMEIVGIS